MDIRFGSFNFPEIENEGPQTAAMQLTFPRAVRRAAVGLTGYSATFGNRDDHHFGFLTVELDSAINATDPRLVDVSSVFGLRDWSGDFDDPYSGIIEFAVLAELEPVSPPVPGGSRGDLVIADAEVNQAIQHFRSHLHLDSANVFPDNSIRLVAGKPTCVRLYVDYDASSGLSPIGRLSGELRITNANGMIVLSPVTSIVPRRDAAIQRARLDHTLTFIIPEGECIGAVDLVARVFNAADPTQFSADFARSISFETMPDLPILAIGIEYTGPDATMPVPLPAPADADFPPLLVFTEAIFPVGAAAITGYNTITYDKEIKSDIGNGCDKFGDILDALDDMRGDSNDIVLGQLPANVDTGSVGGCGRTGVTATTFQNQGTTAHELGHGLGRQHAPCDNVTRCAEPKNSDGGYPHYRGYDSDSIGEFGVDMRAAAPMVRSPANSHDIMGYSGGLWISPYTYKALMSRIPQDFGASGFAVAALERRQQVSAIDRGHWIAVKQPKLFLRLEISKAREIALQPAFCFDALPRANDGPETEFSVELLDRHDRPISRTCLHASHGPGCCDPCSWPKQIRQAIAFDPRARTLVLNEAGNELARWPIERPLEASLQVSGHDDPEAESLALRWKVNADGEDIWSLVQWRDWTGTWRGVAPRTRDRAIEIPKRLFGRSRSATVRVLITGGLATTELKWEGGLTSRPRGRPRLSLVGLDSGLAKPQPAPGKLRAVALEAWGASIDLRNLRWFDRHGAELGRGKTFDLSGMGEGRHRILAAVPGRPELRAEWHVERLRNDRWRLVPTVPAKGGKRSPSPRQSK